MQLVFGCKRGGGIKKAGTVLLNGDKDRNGKTWELNVLNPLYSRFLFFLPQQLVRKARLRYHPA